MNKLALPLLIGLCVVAAAAWLLTGGLDDPSPPTPLPGEHGGQRPGERKGEGDPRRLPSDEGRDPDASAEPQRHATAQRRLLVVGRCLDASSKLPIAACEVRITAQARRGSGLHTEPPVCAEVEGFTAGDGRFTLQIDYPQDHLLQLHTSAPRYADMTGDLAPSGKSVILEDILVPAGALLQGRVLTADRAPLPATTIRIYRQLIGPQPTIHPRSSFSLESDAGGAIDSGVRLACQTWNVHVAGTGLKLIEPATHFEITAGQPVQRVDFIVELPDPKALIRGRVVDGDGRPVPHVVVQAQDGGDWPIGYGYADQDGQFAVRCRKAPGGPVQLAVPQATGFEPMVTPGTVPWGAVDVTLVLERAGDLRVLVVEAGRGNPVEHYAVSWLQERSAGRGGGPHQRGRPAHHPEGRAVVPGIPSGPTRIIITPTDELLAPSDAVSIDMRSGQPELRIELHRRSELRVRVTTAAGTAGTAIAGTRLELVRPQGNDPVTLNSRVVNHGDHVHLITQTGDSAVRLDATTTDRDGNATLRWIAGATPLAIRVLGPGHVPTVQAGVVMREDAPRLDVVVRTGASLSGRLVPLDVLTQLRQQGGSRRWRGLGPRIQLTFAGAGGPTGNQRSKTVDIDEQGAFEFHGLDAGAWEVRFSSTRFGLGRGSTVGSEVLGTVHLGDDTTQRVRYDISRLKPATLRGRILLNGRPAAQKTVHLTELLATDQPGQSTGQSTGQATGQAPGQGLGRGLMLTADDDGRFSTDGLAPGRYSVSVEVVVEGRRRARLTSATLVDIPPGGDIARDFAVTAGHLRVRITDAGGQGIARRLIEVTDPANGFAVGRQTDPAGWIEVAPIATGTYRIRVHSAPAAGNGAAPGTADARGEPGDARQRGPAKGRLVDLGEIVVQAGSAPSTASFVVPAK